MDIKVKEEKIEVITSHMRNYQPGKVAGQKAVEVNRTEGLKVSLEDDSWFLIRPSGTEPLFRLYVESRDIDKMDKITAEVRKIFDF